MKLPLSHYFGLLFVVWLFVAFCPETNAETVASQTQVYSDQKITNRALQELGSNLSGIASSFTFRVSTAKTNQNQFDYTVANTRIYDKDNNSSSIIACTPSNYNPADPLGGLTFTAEGVPSGYEDITLDFSCRNYSFIPGHKYIIVFGSASYNWGSGLMYLAGAAYGSGGTGTSDLFTGGGMRYSSGNLFDYSHSSGSCSGISYIWNDTNPTPKSGCNIWTTSNDDLYFVLTNTTQPSPSPSPTPLSKTPVIFIPGIGGSELKASNDIIWSSSDGHGGTYSHAYVNNEKVWVNQDEAVKLGDDDYFDVLKLKADGVTSEANLSLTGNLTSFGYGDIDSFFQGAGYVKETDFFVFPYDWRKDIRDTKESLDSLVEEAKTKSGKTKVNIVAHSMGGLVARYYISDSSKAAKVEKLIELGVPHLGSIDSLKSLMYGVAMKSKVFGILPLGIPDSETNDIYRNLTSGFQLLPSKKYFNFYNPSIDRTLPYPFWDDRDIDNNGVNGYLSYDQTKTLLSNLGYNSTVFNLAENTHNSLDNSFTQTNGVKVYEIVGNNQPTLGQIIETYYVVWPFNLLPKKDELYINGDDTVPLYSASLKSDTQDISGAYKIYYVEQKHSDLVSSSGTAMQTVKSILNEISLPVEVKDQKINLEGRQISVDQDATLDLYDDSNNHTGLNSSGGIETNIPDTFYDSLDKTKHVFIKKSSSKAKVKITSKTAAKVDIKIRNYSTDSVNKTIFYNDVSVIPASTVQFAIDPTSVSAPSLTADNNTISATSEITGSSALDQTPPITTAALSGTTDSSGIYNSSGAKITLSSNDSESGVLKIEYSLDNGLTVNNYAEPFTVTTSGKNTLLVKSTDKLGNEEKTQTISFEIVSSASSTSSGSTSSSSNSSSSSSDSSSSSGSSASSNSSITLDKISSSKILTSSFQNSMESKTQLTQQEVLGIQSEANTDTNQPSSKHILNIILITSAGIVAAASISLGATFAASGSLTVSSIINQIKAKIKIFF